MNQDSFNEIENVASATECTGLMPALPADMPDGDENTARLYAIHAPEKKRKNKCRRREKTPR